jgi:hypothetical protein
MEHPDQHLEDGLLVEVVVEIKAPLMVLVKVELAVELQEIMLILMFLYQILAVVEGDPHRVVISAPLEVVE